MIITGITITFKPTWNRKILSQGLKIQQVLANGDYKPPATWWEQFAAGAAAGAGADGLTPDAVTHAAGLIAARDEDAVISNEMLVSTMGKVPYGAWPRLYAKHLDYGDSQNGATIMANQAQAKMRRASSVSLINGDKKTFRFVPKVFKTSRTADGLEITKPAPAGWFPTDDIHLRRFGGMDFCISPFPNFDVQTEKDSRLVYDYKTGKWGKQGLKSQADDRTSLNDHQVVVRRTYHIKFRGRKRHQTDLNERLKEADWNLKPTDLTLSQRWKAGESLPPPNVQGTTASRENNLYADIHTQTASPLSLSATAGLIQDTVVPNGAMPSKFQANTDYGNVEEEHVYDMNHPNGEREFDGTILERVEGSHNVPQRTNRAPLQPYGQISGSGGPNDAGTIGRAPFIRKPHVEGDAVNQFGGYYVDQNHQATGKKAEAPTTPMVPRPDQDPYPAFAGSSIPDPSPTTYGNTDNSENSGDKFYPQSQK
jgi:hypothetical protein